MNSKSEALQLQLTTKRSLSEKESVQSSMQTFFCPKIVTQVQSYEKIETRLIGSILISLILLEQETEAKACGIQKEGAS